MSAHILQINFTFDTSVEDYQKLATSIAGAFAEVPGLIWKVWIMNETDKEAGGIYLFDSADSLSTFVNSPLAEQVKTHPNLKNLSAKPFEVMEEATAITRGPLTVPA